MRSPRIYTREGGLLDRPRSVVVAGVRKMGCVNATSAAARMTISVRGNCCDVVEDSESPENI